MSEVEIGIGKSGRRAYGLADISIIPSRRTRDPQDVEIAWSIDAYDFDMPIMAAASDSITSPATAVEMGRLGGVASLNLEGLWTRYEDPQPLLDELAELPDDRLHSRLREVYDEPVKEELIVERIRAVRDAGYVSSAALTPQQVQKYAPKIAEAELDLLVIHGTIVSAEHVSKTNEPLNLKRFIREFEIPTIAGGCASYQAALHLMRTGAVGVLVGVGSGLASTTGGVLGVNVPQATAIADARGARMRHLDETGVYVHLISNGGVTQSGEIAKAIACGADAVMLGSPLAAAQESPGKGFYWDASLSHPILPKSRRLQIGTTGTLEQILTGPASEGDGQLNLCGALRTAMSTCGYQTIKELQKAEVTVAPVPRSGSGHTTNQDKDN